MISTKMVGMLVAAFAAGSFLASPLPEAIAAVIATDVQCTGCVGTSDLAGNAVTAAKLKDGEVKAAEIAANAVGSSEIATNAVGADEVAFDAVGADEIKGVDKLIFADCPVPATGVPQGIGFKFSCTVAGVDPEDNAIASLLSKDAGSCYAPSSITPLVGKLDITLKNTCSFTALMPTGSTMSVIVYDELPDKVLP